MARISAQVIIYALAYAVFYAVCCHAGCGCDYYSSGNSGCKINSGDMPSSGQACYCHKSSFFGVYSCAGYTDQGPCVDTNSGCCQNPQPNYLTCMQGGGDCNGYTTAARTDPCPDVCVFAEIAEPEQTCTLGGLESVETSAEQYIDAVNMALLSSLDYVGPMFSVMSSIYELQAQENFANNLIDQINAAFANVAACISQAIITYDTTQTCLLLTSIANVMEDIEDVPAEDTALLETKVGFAYNAFISNMPLMFTGSDDLEISYQNKIAVWVATLPLFEVTAIAHLVVMRETVSEAGFMNEISSVMDVFEDFAIWIENARASIYAEYHSAIVAQKTNGADLCTNQAEMLTELDVWSDNFKVKYHDKLAERRTVVAGKVFYNTDWTEELPTTIVPSNGYCPMSVSVGDSFNISFELTVDDWEQNSYLHIFDIGAGSGNEMAFRYDRGNDRLYFKPTIDSWVLIDGYAINANNNGQTLNIELVMTQSLAVVIIDGVTVVSEAKGSHSQMTNEPLCFATGVVPSGDIVDFKIETDVAPEQITFSNGNCPRSVSVGDSFKISFELTVNDWEQINYLHIFDIGAGSGNEMAFRYDRGNEWLYFKPTIDSWVYIDGINANNNGQTLNIELVMTQSHAVVSIDGVTVVSEAKGSHSQITNQPLCFATGNAPSGNIVDFKIETPEQITFSSGNCPRSVSVGDSFKISFLLTVNDWEQINYLHIFDIGAGSGNEMTLRYDRGNEWLYFKPTIDSWVIIDGYPINANNNGQTFYIELVMTQSNALVIIDGVVAVYEAKGSHSQMINQPLCFATGNVPSGNIVDFKIETLTSEVGNGLGIGARNWNVMDIAQRSGELSGFVALLALNLLCWSVFLWKKCGRTGLVYRKVAFEESDVETA